MNKGALKEATEKIYKDCCKTVQQSFLYYILGKLF